MPQLLLHRLRNQFKSHHLFRSSESSVIYLFVQLIFILENLMGIKRNQTSEKREEIFLSAIQVPRNR